MSEETKFEGQVVVNRVEIVEWLGPSDTKTGDALHEFLNALQGTNLIPPTPSGPFQFACSPVTSKAAFLQKLADIAAASTIEKLPILHIEAHGNEKGLGAESASGAKEFVSWAEMAEQIRKINRASRNNLIVVGAACFGFASLGIGVEDVEKPSAFYVAVGPDKEVTPTELEQGFALFYTEFFKSLNFNSAVDAGNKTLGGALKFVTTESIFYGGVANYVREGLNDAAVAETLKRWEKKGLSPKQLEVGKQALLNSRQPETWESYYRLYMHCHHVENAARFRFQPIVLAKHIKGA